RPPGASAARQMSQPYQLLAEKPSLHPRAPRHAILHSTSCTPLLLAAELPRPCVQAGRPFLPASYVKSSRSRAVQRAISGSSKAHLRGLLVQKAVKAQSPTEK